MVLKRGHYDGRNCSTDIKLLSELGACDADISEYHFTDSKLSILITPFKG